MSKTYTFFSRFEGTRGEKTQIFRTIEAAKSAVKIEPKWWSAYQTLGRAHLGFGQIQEAVIVSFIFEKDI